MLNKDKIENFAFNCDRPFSVYEASELCNVSLKKSQMHIQALRKEGKIKLQRKVNKKYFYIWNGKPKIIHTKSTQASKEMGDKIEKIITEDGYTNLRDIAIKAECSYELVRLVIVDRKLDNVNKENLRNKETKIVQADFMHVLRVGKRIVKLQKQQGFLNSIVPYGVRG